VLHHVVIHLDYYQGKVFINQLFTHTES